MREQNKVPFFMKGGDALNVLVWCAFRRPEFSVFVGDLASDVDDFQLHQVFKKFPSCKGAKVVTDQYGYSRYGRCAQFDQARLVGI